MNRLAFFLVTFVMAAWYLGYHEAFAQSSLGIGRGEQPLPTGGFFEGFFSWVRSQQAVFHNNIREILLAMRKEGTHFWALISISFLYGIFHAVGPGHGKVVVSSYMLANEIAAKRGVIISMAASIAQGMTAIVAISFFMLVLRGTGIKSGELTYGLEMASYIGVMAIGVWLVWRKLFRRSHSHAHPHDHAHDHHHSHGDMACDDCGHAHAPDPKMLTGTFGLREAWTAILAVGLRPCTGALIILVFCFANGLYLAGVLSTFAMSIGTGISVSGMAVLAVMAKNAALKLANFQDSVGVVHQTIEVAGAAFIFLIGLVLFTAMLSG
ncbi:MAG: nickel/cobalt transporter [Pseudomonadota bacterium]